MAEATTETKFMCDKTTPLGRPVEPDVYMIMATSSGLGATALRFTWPLIFAPVLITLSSVLQRTDEIQHAAERGRGSRERD